ncbi:Uma2 family endonuclease [Actinoplanes sp. TBRC 11911]|uniref:Uma2 family endonuclease n=1 Tax=Actinoplanes sp. TBRC 11911 TaxID=2729386 RepID=UPI00145F9D7D|nr:Uma2 family endonuclease [Actinoplanes sp. TBRC 11911]NMO51423.1 Uma2 family endonuclease [Actinoplanes sp. TBRC 11911]
MAALHLPRIEDLDVDDLAALPKGYGYELHEGSLVITPPSTFWHKEMARRLLNMLSAAGLEAFPYTGILGDRPRDSRCPDIGVVISLPANPTTVSHLPGSAYRLVVEIVEKSARGEYTDKARWYAERGVPEYWIVDGTPEYRDDEAAVLIFRLNGRPEYVRERTVLLSELEAEYAAR